MCVCLFVCISVYFKFVVFLYRQKCNVPMVFNNVMGAL